jgi:hypothetical protein
VVYHLTLGIDATGANAGIDALQVAAGLVCWAIRVDRAFWSTIGIGITEIAAYTGAGSTISLRLALSIGATWRGEARILGSLHRLWRDDLRDLVALSKWITFITRRAFAYGYMVAR